MHYTKMRTFVSSATSKEEKWKLSYSGMGGRTLSEEMVVLTLGGLLEYLSYS